MKNCRVHPTHWLISTQVPTKSRNPLVVRGTYSFVQEPERRSFFASLIKVLTAPFTFLFGSR